MICRAQKRHIEALHQLLVENISGTHPTSAAWLHERLVSSSSIIMIDEEMDQLVGGIVGLVVMDEAEIHDIAVHAPTRRQGRAARLVQAFEHHASERGVRTIFLEVRAHNEAAKKLYKKAGFSLQHTRPRYYPDGEDALIFQKKLEAQP